MISNRYRYRVVKLTKIPQTGKKANKSYEMKNNIYKLERPGTPNQVLT